MAHHLSSNDDLHIEASGNIFRSSSISKDQYSIMIRVSITVLITALSLIRTINCDTADRLEAGTRECNWRPITTDFYHIYTTLERKLQEEGLPKQDLDSLYKFTANEVDLWTERLFLTRKSTTFIAALSQLKQLRDLDKQDCGDYCAFVLAKNNCNTAAHLHACRPGSMKDYYLKVMIDATVFPFMERCLAPLMGVATIQNSTLIEPQLYEAVSLVTQRMIESEPASELETIDDMVLASTKPFLKARRIVRPARSGFWKNLAGIMIELDKQRGEASLRQDITSRSLRAPKAKQHYQQLVLQPCQEFIRKMHRTMDPLIFYGRTIDLKRSKFKLEPTSDALKIKSFRVSLLYEGCVSLDNQEYQINWSALNRELLAFR